MKPIKDFLNVSNQLLFKRKIEKCDKKHKRYTSPFPSVTLCQLSGNGHWNLTVVQLCLSFAFILSENTLQKTWKGLSSTPLKKWCYIAILLSFWLKAVAVKKKSGEREGKSRVCWWVCLDTSCVFAGDSWNPLEISWRSVLLQPEWVCDTEWSTSTSFSPLRGAARQSNTTCLMPGDPKIIKNMLQLSPGIPSNQFEKEGCGCLGLKPFDVFHYVKL